MKDWVAPRGEGLKPDFIKTENKIHRKDAKIAKKTVVRKGNTKAAEKGKRMLSLREGED